MDSLPPPPQREQCRCICFCAMPAALPAPSSRSAEEWDFLQLNVLKASRSSKVCITCQHFRYEVDRHCVTLLTCPIHQGLIPQGEHLTKRCSGGVIKGVWCVSLCSATLNIYEEGVFLLILKDLISTLYRQTSAFDPFFHVFIIFVSLSFLVLVIFPVRYS